MTDAAPLAELIEQLRRLPGIGAKSATRLAYQILSWQASEIEEFAAAIARAGRDIGYCPRCFNFSTRGELCDICSDQRRDAGCICVVASVRELHAMERTREYRGLYHVLHGLISPLDGVGPDDLKIRELLTRCQEHSPGEVIVALNPSTEGEATTLYLIKLLRPLLPRISRLAFGIAVGAELDQTDELTLARALEGRQELAS